MPSDTSMKEEPGTSLSNSECRARAQLTPRGMCKSTLPPWQQPAQAARSHQDLCYRTKVKCVGRENPPCGRCAASGQECTFDGRRKSKMTQVEKYVWWEHSVGGGTGMELTAAASLISRCRSRRCRCTWRGYSSSCWILRVRVPARRWDQVSRCVSLLTGRIYRVSIYPATNARERGRVRPPGCG